MHAPNKKQKQRLIVATATVLFALVAGFQWHLESFGCKRPGTLRSTTMTPAELAQGAHGCVQLKRYDDAAYMLTLGETFQQFEALRTSRPAEPGALTRAVTERLAPVDRTALQAGFAKLDVPNRKEAFCRALKSTRAPAYPVARNSREPETSAQWESMVKTHPSCQ